MQSIERLRAIVSATWLDAQATVREAAQALSWFGDDDPGLVVACRRLVDHRPELGAMWWLASTVLSSSDPAEAAERVAAQFEDDPTVMVLAEELPAERHVAVVGRPPNVFEALGYRSDCRVFLVGIDDLSGVRRQRLRIPNVDPEWIVVSEVADVLGAGDVLIVDALSVGPQQVLVAAEASDAIDLARPSHAEVWAVTGVGRSIVEPLWRAQQRCLDRRGPADTYRLIDHGDVDAFITPEGFIDARDGLVCAPIDCPVAPELLRVS